MACRTCDMIKALLLGAGMSDPMAQAISHAEPIQRAEERVKRKVTRKASTYAKEFGKILKKLKKKSPRTAIGTLMKRAHKLTKKKLKR